MPRVRYGAFTADMMGRIVALAGVGGKPWARLVVYLTDKIARGDTLEFPEAVWLDRWLSEHEGVNCEDVLVVQVSLRRIAEDLFNGHKAMAVRAVNQLIEEGVLELVSKGQPGHSSLYIMGLLWVTETNEIVTHEGKGGAEAMGHRMSEVGNKSAEVGHRMSEVGNSGDCLTCGNDDISILNHSNSHPIYRESECKSALEDKKCPACGSSDIEAQYGALHYCRACRTDFVMLSGKPKKPAHDSRAA